MDSESSEHLSVLVGTVTNQVRLDILAMFFVLICASTTTVDLIFHDLQIVVGSLVRVHSLLSNTNYNGVEGVVIRLLEDRYRVRLPTGLFINVPLQNLELIPPTDSTEVRVLYISSKPRHRHIRVQ